MDKLQIDYDDPSIIAVIDEAITMNAALRDSGVYLWLDPATGSHRLWADDGKISEGCARLLMNNYPAIRVAHDALMKARAAIDAAASGRRAPKRRPRNRAEANR